MNVTSQRRPMQISKLLALVFALTLVGACQKPATVAPDTTTAGGAGTEDSSARQTGVGPGGVQEGMPFEDEFGISGDGELLDQIIIYFDFDRSDIRGEYADVLAAHAEYLANNPQISIRLEGHADERGTREYNVGLGERRSQAVRRVLMLQGTSTGQLSTVSYGEERPAITGSNEASWAQNRRVEIIYIR